MDIPPKNVTPVFFVLDKYYNNHITASRKDLKDPQRIIKRLKEYLGEHAEDDDVVRMRDDMAQRFGPSTANITLSFLSSACSHAHIPKPRVSLIKKKGGRTRFLSPSEMERFWREVKRAKESPPKNKTMIDCIAFMLLTGARRHSAVGVKWEDIYIKENMWRLRCEKASRVFNVPLSKGAMAIIKERKRKDNDFIFLESKNMEAGYNLIHREWVSLCKRASIKGAVLHDLRRTFATYLSESGAGIHEIQEMLCHKDIKSTMVYAKVTEYSVRMRLEALEKFIKTQ